MTFDKILAFEKELAKFTGAPYAIMTDCCTHAIEMCLRYCKVKHTKFTAYTYLSVPMTMHKLNINYELVPMQCLSFGHGKPLAIGRGGAILLDDVVAYDTILHQRYDGRDLTVSPWQDQTVFKVGFHYKPTIEEAQQGLALLEGVKESKPIPAKVHYPDLRKITIVP